MKDDELRVILIQLPAILLLLLFGLTSFAIYFVIEVR